MVPKKNASEEKNNVREVAAGEWHFRRVLEKLPAGAYTCDSEGLITYFNEQAVQIWGRAPKLRDGLERFCGSFKLFSADGLPIDRDQCWMALALKNGRDYNGKEIIIERPDGSRVTVLAHANPIHDTAGNLLGAVNVLVDIQNRKSAEEALRQADQAKNDFLAIVAHELRNPLAPMRNAIQILRLKGGSSSELDLIERQMVSMTRIIDDLLDVARITNNKLELRKAHIDLSEVLEAAVEISRPLMQSRGHDFIFAEPTERLYIDGDSVRLSQVIANLLNNAARYTDPQGRIELSAEANGGSAIVTVRDSGMGIAAEWLPHIFELYSRSARATTRTQEGLGIGLTLVKRLVEMHGGTVTAHSEGRGEGSCFTLRLPLVSQPIDVQPVRITNPAIAVTLNPLRILVVDDDHDVANSLKSLLELLGHTVQSAHDSTAAVNLAEEFRPEVILLDIGLPRVDGYAVARIIRQRSWGKNIVLIAVTGWGQVDHKQLSKQAGFDHHFTKPVDMPKLLSLLASLPSDGSQRGSKAN